MTENAQDDSEQQQAPASAIQIEPLTKEERKEKESGILSGNPEQDPEYPKDWIGKPIAEVIGKGFRYYKKLQSNGKTYMVLRRGRHDRGLGAWTQEKEQKLFNYYPQVGTMAGISPLAPMHKGGTARQHVGGTPGNRPLLSVPIRRVAIIPRDYIPNIDVIRYFQIMKNNGFGGDFSQFINDIVTEHFVRCHGIVLPVLLREEMERDQ